MTNDERTAYVRSVAITLQQEFPGSAVVLAIAIPEDEDGEPFVTFGVRTVDADLAIAAGNALADYVYEELGVPPIPVVLTPVVPE